MIHADARVHERAIVNDSDVGARTRVWQYASVIRGSVIGEDSVIAAYACIDGSKVGNGTSISHGVVLYPGSVVGNKVFIGPHVACCNDRWPIASKDGFDIEAFLKGFVSTSIGDGSGIGAGAIILPGIYVGKGSMVAAGAVVDKSVPDGHLLKRDGSIVKLDGRIPRRMRGCADRL